MSLLYIETISITYIFWQLTLHNSNFVLYKSDRLQIASTDAEYNRNGISPPETSAQTDSHRQILASRRTIFTKEFHESKVVISIIFSFQFAKRHRRKFYHIFLSAYVWRLCSNLLSFIKAKKWTDLNNVKNIILFFL